MSHARLCIAVLTALIMYTYCRACKCMQTHADEMTFFATYKRAPHQIRRTCLYSQGTLVNIDEITQLAYSIKQTQLRTIKCDAV